MGEVLMLLRLVKTKDLWVELGQGCQSLKMLLYQQKGCLRAHFFLVGH